MNFWRRRFPDSRRTAYYLMSIHEHLPPQIRRELETGGLDEGGGVGQGRAFGREGLRLCSMDAQSPFHTAG